MRSRPAVSLVVAGLVAGSSAVRAEIPPIATAAVVAGQASFEAASSTYVFTAGSVSYFVPVGHADVKAGMLRVEAKVGTRARSVVVAKGGARYRDGAGAVLEPDALAALGKATLQSHTLDQGALELRYAEAPAAHALAKTYRFRLAGTALVVEASSTATFGADGWAGLSMGATEATPGARVVSLPFLPEPIAVLADGTFLCAYVDRTLSSGSSVSARSGPMGAQSVAAHGFSTIVPSVAGASAPLEERAYVVLSDRVEDAFPGVVGSPSPYRASLSRKLVLDVWGQHGMFAPPEGVALVWTAPAGAAGTAHVTVAYGRGAGNDCGDGVRLVVTKAGALLEQRDLPAGPFGPADYQADVPLAEGEALSFDVLRNANNNCDGMNLRATLVTAANGTYDSVADFSSTDGQRGFSYREIAAGARVPMTYDTATGWWKGTGAYSILGAGFAHPGQRPASYGDAQAMVERLAEYGMVELAVLFHVWQRHGYDAGLPEHYPANAAGGTGAQMKGFVAAAKAEGMLVALHENYTDLYPDAPPDFPSPLFDASAIALDPNGSRKLGWLNTGTGQQAFVVASDRMLALAQKQSPLIAADYAPNATYLDVSTGWSPDRSIDFAAAAPIPATMKAAYEAHVALFDGMKGFYQGPLFGEAGEGPGRFDSYFAGPVDAVERQVEGRMRAMVAPEYELLAVRPRQLNHGLGYYSRYFVPEGQGRVTRQTADLDQYRASEIAFGHAGFLGEGIEGLTPAESLRLHAREYFLVQELQSRYADATLASVVHVDGANRLTLSQALQQQLDLSVGRVELSYGGGLTVAVNRDSPQRAASAAAKFSATQGEGGFGYYEEGAGGALVPMTWDAASGLWKGARQFSLIWASGMHPDGPPVVRTWTAPVAATVRVQGTVSDGNPNCGDGIDVEIRHGTQVLWSQTLSNGGASQGFDLAVPMAAGDQLWFRVAQRADNGCDGTNFAPVMSYDDGADHGWQVTTPAGVRTLPPGSFAAWAPDGFLAYTAQGAQGRVDYLRSAAYSFADARGTLTTIEDLKTDGLVAIVPRAAGDELHVIQATVVARGGTELLKGSVPADVNLKWLDARRARLSVRSVASGKVDLTWAGLPAGWVAALTAHPDEVEIVDCDAAGQPLGAPRTLRLDAGLALGTLFSERHYLVRETSECLASSDCTGKACVAGRCKASSPDAGLPTPDASESADAAEGGPDAASSPDAASAGADAGLARGDAGSTSQPPSGCGCGAAPGAPALAMAVLVLPLRRRRRAMPSSPAKADSSP